MQRVTSAEWWGRKPWTLLSPMHTLIQQQFTNKLPLSEIQKQNQRLPDPEGYETRLTEASREIGKPSCENPYPQHRAIQSGRDPLTPSFSRGGKELAHVSSNPTFPRGHPRGLASVLLVLEVVSGDGVWAARHHNSSLWLSTEQANEKSFHCFPFSPGRQSWSMCPVVQFLWGYPKNWHVSCQSWSAILFPGGQLRWQFGLVDAIALLPSSAQSKPTKTTAACFSLEREEAGLVIWCHTFSRGCLKDWLLTCLFWNAIKT